jgi:16S rRNA (cytosine1402-N4)-methyltransferase
LYEKVLEYLITDKSGLYIDGTLGAGGHAAGIAGILQGNGKLIAFDKDEEAIEYCGIKFRGENDTKGERVILINDSYDKACSITEGAMISGFFLDLGLSSRQLDKAERGFSFRSDAPIDMRFGRKGESAELLINTATEEELYVILKKYGEEPFTRNIVKRLITTRITTNIKTTFQLAEIIRESVPRQHHNKSLARVFQAIRIAINNELDILEWTLVNILPKMMTGGRIVIISYHSLEDKIVKDFFRKMSVPQEKDEITGAIIIPAELKILTKKPIVPDDAELVRNPRSRSAKLRVAEITS